MPGPDSEAQPPQARARPAGEAGIRLYLEEKGYHAGPGPRHPYPDAVTRRVPGRPAALPGRDGGALTRGRPRERAGGPSRYPEPTSRGYPEAARRGYPESPSLSPGGGLPCPAPRAPRPQPEAGLQAPRRPRLAGGIQAGRPLPRYPITGGRRLTLTWPGGRRGLGEGRPRDTRTGPSRIPCPPPLPAPGRGRGGTALTRCPAPPGEPWRVAADVCRALGIANAAHAVAFLSDRERRLLDAVHIGLPNTNGRAPPEPVRRPGDPGHGQGTCAGRWRLRIRAEPWRFWTPGRKNY
jgi:hypothetical protein